MPTSVVLVSGTWGAQWAKPGSLLLQKFAQHNVEVLQPAYEWSEDVSGIPSLWTGGKHSDWRAGGYSFGLRMAQLPYRQRIAIAHSYGGNVCAYGLIASTAVPIRRLITVGTPFREDMRAIWKLAEKNVGYHLHVCDPSVPMIERVAQLFDGRWGFRAQVGHPTADLVVKIPKSKHSKVLDHEKLVEQWESLGLMDYITRDSLEGERIHEPTAVSF